jgi:large subunit ribosomal protein L35
MKLKTRQVADKRFRFTKTGKCLRRKAGQDHFNSREPGKVTRGKRGNVHAFKADAKNIKGFLPYN